MRALAFIAIAIASAAFAIGATLTYVERSQQDKVTIPGELTLHEPSIGTVDRSGPACYGTELGHYDDIRGGQVMILRSASGEVLSRAYLEPGEWRPTTGALLGGDCVFRFAFEDVDLGDHEMFNLQIGYSDRYGDGVPHTREEVLTRGVWARIEGGL